MIADTSCPWCDEHDGAGQLFYEGWILAVRSESGWLLHPWRQGLGGLPLALPSEAVPPSWLEQDADAVAALVELLVHPHTHDTEPDKDVTREGTAVELDTTLAVPARTVARLQAVRDHWRATVQGARHRIDFPPGMTEQEGAVLQRARMWCWEAPPGDPGWQFEDAEGFLADRRERQWSDNRERLRSARAWVNPYNFVPLGGDGPDKAPPEFHLSLTEGRLSGRMEVTFTALAPLALSGTGAGKEEDPHRPFVVDGRHVLPGAAIAGVVRSFHEALTDSCLRVVDTDFVPVHRDLARPQEPGQWRMAVVEPSGTSVRLCAPVLTGSTEYSAIWVEARDLGPAPIDSTHLFHLDLERVTGGVVHSRLERTDGDVPVKCTTGDSCTEQHWRTIVTAALPKRKRNPNTAEKEHAYHLPFAPMSTTRMDVPEQALRLYMRSAAQAHDVVVRARAADPILDVQDIGARQETTARLTPDQVMWVQLSGDTIVRVTPSVLWRNPGEHSVGNRITGYGPCTDVESLCPSCRLFGMAEERDADAADAGSGSGPTRVASYRGHVRFGLAVVDDVEETATRLTEMGTPRPGAGQFYLDNAALTEMQAGNGRRPLREWGSDADDPQPRRIRGRKFYWANSTTERYLADADAHDQMSSHHYLSPPGTHVSFPVTFENLTPTQLGALITSLNPDVLRTEPVRGRIVRRTGDLTLRGALERCLGHHLGKGKGVGLGTVTAQIRPTGDAEAPAEGAPTVPVTLWTATRYTAPGTSTLVDGLEYVRQFVDAELSPGAHGRWAALLALSALDWVPPERVMYPPDDARGGHFQSDFWKKSAGAPGTVKGHAPTLVALPPADSADVSVPRPWLGRQR